MLYTNHECTWFTEAMNFGVWAWLFRDLPRDFSAVMHFTVMSKSTNVLCKAVNYHTLYLKRPHWLLFGLLQLWRMVANWHFVMPNKSSIAFLKVVYFSAGIWNFSHFPPLILEPVTEWKAIVSAMFYEHNVTVNWCREFAVINFAIFKLCRVFCTFRLWFSSSPSNVSHIKMITALSANNVN